MKKKGKRMRSLKKLILAFGLCVALLFGREKMYALQMESVDMEVEVPVFFLLIEGEDDSYITSAFYIEDTNGTGNTYLVTSVYAGAYADAGYTLTLVAENVWEEVTAVKMDKENGLTYLKADNMEHVNAFASEATMDETNGILVYMSVENDKFEIEAGSLDISNFNKTNGIYYTGVSIESRGELVLLGAPYLNGDSAGVMGMFSMSTDSELILYDFTQLDYMEEMAIVTRTVQSQPEEPEDSERESEQPVDTEEPEQSQNPQDTQKPNESEHQEGEAEQNPSDMQDNQPSDGQQAGADQVKKDYGWLIVVVAVVAMGVLYTKNNQKKKPEQSGAASEESIYPEGTIMLSDEAQKEIDAAISSQNEVYRKGEPNMYWQIRGISGVFAGQVFVLEERLDFGRNMYCKVIFPQDTKGISNKHCYLRIENNVVIIRDDNSSYGTYLGRGIRLEPGIGYQLNDGDVFYLASQEQSFRLECVRSFVS